MQRFGSKAGLKRSALLLAWDRLDQRTAALAAQAPPTPRGAIEILVGLSTDYGGVEAYAEGLLLLREDLRDPALRARGAAWKVALCAALEDRFRRRPRRPAGDRPAAGLAVAGGPAVVELRPPAGRAALR